MFETEIERGGGEKRILETPSNRKAATVVGVGGGAINRHFRFRLGSGG